MAEPSPPPAQQPGTDEIVVTAPAPGTSCNTLTCKHQGRLADLVITYGQLGTHPWDKDSLWPGSWGRSYPQCRPCWDSIRDVAETHRPGLVVTDHTRREPVRP